MAVRRDDAHGRRHVDSFKWAQADRLLAVDEPPTPADQDHSNRPYNVNQTPENIARRPVSRHRNKKRECRRRRRRRRHLFGYILVWRALKRRRRPPPPAAGRRGRKSSVKWQPKYVCLCVRLVAPIGSRGSANQSVAEFGSICIHRRTARVCQSDRPSVRLHYEFPFEWSRPATSTSIWRRWLSMV